MKDENVRGATARAAQLDLRIQFPRLASHTRQTEWDSISTTIRARKRCAWRYTGVCVVKPEDCGKPGFQSMRATALDALRLLRATSKVHFGGCA